VQIITVWLAKLRGEEQSAEFEGLVRALPAAAIGAGTVFAGSLEANCWDTKLRWRVFWQLSSETAEPPLSGRES